MIDFWRQQLFQLLYNNRYLYWFASTIPFAGQWRIWQRLVLSRMKGNSALEIGCGLGDLLADAIEAGYKCFAIEQSEEMVDAARHNLQQRHLGKPDCIIQGLSQNLPFPNCSFDNVISTFPNEYIYDSKTISEIKRVLRPNGRLIIVFAAKLLPVNPVQLTLLLIPTLVYGHDTFVKGLESIKKNERNAPTDEIFVDYNVRFGEQIPFAEQGFHCQYERVYTYFWEAYIIVGETNK
ncbi:class I SAM-dependent methyltransferase [Synechocystis sp. PCC 7509]|uniref:class I SAM-dependent methyltransferase n=1 Tax=Synechocystis sp. PCC 7509 TaxID=927677 RepID=UPI0002ACAEDA|nr:class I SAM-dependent methyltransferase [Synechocystis sp. PCC 7509]